MGGHRSTRAMLHLSLILRWSSFLLSISLLQREVDCASGSHVVATFVDSTDGNVTINNHLVVHKETGIIFVGSVNRIYQLDPSLRLIAHNKTGPSEDSFECSGYRDCPEKAQVRLTNNVNKALVVDYSRAKLISCGSLYQGVCWILNLDNVSNTEEFISEPIVANNDSASTVAFIAPGPPTPPTSAVSVLFIPACMRIKIGFRV
jgi:plexin A